MVKRVRTGGLAAEKSEMPGFIKPQLATLKAKAPAGDQWFHEIKFDGYRIQIHLNRGKRKVYTQYRDITSEGLLRQSSFKGFKRN